MTDPSQFEEMTPCFRWFGPGDPVRLEAIRQCGCAGIFTALHDIPAGQPWTRAAIRERKELLAEQELPWLVAESVPVSEAIKTRSGDWEAHAACYAESIRNLAAEGIRCAMYNFMPVLDWVRTDLAIMLPDGTRTTGYDPVRWTAFDLCVLKRPGAEADYAPEQAEQAQRYFASLGPGQAAALERDIIDIFPGQKGHFQLDDIRRLMAAYAEVGTEELRSNLAAFLERILPVAEEAGVRLVVHPDDPPFPVLGLPRIVSTAADLEYILSLSDSPANGLCLCPGSLGVRPDNDLVEITRLFADRIQAVHLRNIVRGEDGSFRESPHLEGVVDMAGIVAILLKEQQRRRETGRADWRLPLRPDHGLTMLDDLAKPPPVTPGYHCLGRMKGLAELRGLQAGLGAVL